MVYNRIRRALYTSTFVRTVYLCCSTQKVCLRCEPECGIQNIECPQFVCGFDLSVKIAVKMLKNLALNIRRIIYCPIYIDVLGFTPASRLYMWLQSPRTLTLVGVPENVACHGNVIWKIG